MGSWTVIETDFTDDETCNFGARIEECTDNCLYSLQTVSTVNTTSQISKTPQFFGRSCRKFSSIVVDSVVHIFKIDPFEFVLTIDFEKSIKWINVIDQLNLLLVVTDIAETSKLHFFSLNEQKFVHFHQFIQNEKFVENSSLIKTAFEKGFLNLIYHSKKSKCLFFVRFDVKNGEIDDFKQPFVRNCSISTEVLGENYEICGFIDENNFFLIGDEICSVFHFDGTILTFKGSFFGSFGSETIVSCEIICSKHFLLVVQNNGDVLLIDIVNLTLQERWKFSSIVEDLVVFDEQFANEISVANVKIAAMRRFEENFLVEIRSLKDFPQTLYSYTSGNRMTLVGVDSDRRGSFFILEAVKTNLACKFVDQIRIRLIDEANPNDKLNRLIGRRNFRDAERFATLYRLDAQSIYKAEAQFLLSNGTSFELIVECLTKISNDVDVATLCRDSSSLCPSLIDRLKYALNRLKRNFSIDQSTKEKIFGEISRLLHRRSTFEMIFVDETSIADAWYRLNQAKMIDIFDLLLKNCQFSQANLIFVRHETEIVVEIDEEYLKNIFSFISHIYRSNLHEAMIDFLAVRFLPVVLRCVPTFVEIVADFLHDHSISLQFIDRDRTLNGDVSSSNAFPKNALEFAEILHRVKNDFVERMQISTAGDITRLSYCLSVMNVDYVDETSSIGRLNQSIKNFNEILRLFDVYNLKMTLDDVVDATEKSICFRMLDKIGAIELLSDAVTTKILPYCDEKRLNIDSILVEYVEDFLRRTMNAGDSTHVEKRILIIYRFLKSIDAKCRCVLKLIEFSSIPISSDVEKLMIEAENYKHPLASQILEQRKYLRVKAIFASYDLPPTSITNPKAAAFNILTRCSPDAVDCALRVVEIFKVASKLDCLYFRLTRLLSDAQVDEAIDFLKNLSLNERKICLHRLIERINVDADLLDVYRIDDDDYERISNQLDIVSPFVDEISDRNSLETYFSLRIKLKSAKILLSSFDISISFRLFEDEKFVADLLDCVIERFATIDSNLNRLITLAYLLNIDVKKFFGKLIAKKVSLEKFMILIEYLSIENFNHTDFGPFSDSFSSYIDSLLIDSNDFSDRYMSSIENFFGNLLTVCDANHICSISDTYAKFFSFRIKRSGSFQSDDDSVFGMKRKEKISDATSCSTKFLVGEKRFLIKKWSKYVEIFMDKFVLERNEDVYFGFSLLLTLPTFETVEIFKRLQRISLENRKKRRILFIVAGAVSKYRDADRTASLNWFKNSFYLNILLRFDVGKQKRIVDDNVGNCNDEEKTLDFVDFLIDSIKNVVGCREIIDLLYVDRDFDDILLKIVERRLLKVENFDDDCSEFVAVRRLIATVKGRNVFRLAQMFSNVLQRANPYSYEIIQYALQFLCKFDETKLNFRRYNDFLQFLRRYERVSSIGIDESAYLAARSKDFGTSSTLPDDSSYRRRRLPFHYFFHDEFVVEFWSNVMKNEINFDNINFWTTILETCFVDGPITKINLINFATDNAFAESNFDAETLVKVVILLTNEENYKNSIDLMARIAKRLNSTELRVEAYKFCLRLLHRRYETISKMDRTAEIDTLKQSLAVFEMKYRKLETEKCLLEANLITESTKLLLDQPARLIRYLLDVDYSPSQRGQLSSTLVRLAKINSIDLNKLYECQLDDWFKKKFVSCQDDDCTNTWAFSNGNNSMCCDFLDLSSKPLEKISLLFHEKSDENVLYHLLSIAKSEDLKFSFVAKVQAVRVLFWIFTPKRIEVLLKKDPEELRTLLTDLIYGAWFENLAMPQTSTSFHEFNKSALLNSLCKNLSKRKNTFNVAVSLLIDFSIHDKKLIEALIKFSSDSTCSKDLSIALLITIHSNVDLWCVDCSFESWKKICDRLKAEKGFEAALDDLIKKCPQL